MSAVDTLYRRMKDDLEEADEDISEESEIANYLAGKTLFITGITGFLGKCLMEKLLRSCPDIKHIYVMMRCKDNVSINEVLIDYFQDEVFESLRQINPTFGKKVTAFRGDLIKDKLGLSDTEREILKNEVNIIIHNAANVKFDLRISLALRINVLGTKSMLDLSAECKNLEVFMYMSTAYSHCYRKHIKEIFYQPPANLQEVYDLIKKDNKTTNGLSQDEIKFLLGEYPNVYTYSKGAAEDLIRQYTQYTKAVYVVYRPSIVMSALKEPLPGWVGNTNGSAYIYIGGVLGYARTGYTHGYPNDFIPSDYAINALITVIWDAGCKYKNNISGSFVYNYGSTTVNPVSFKVTTDFLGKHITTILSVKTVWLPSGMYTDKLWIFWILHILLHFLPACLLDLILILRGKRPRLVSLFMKITKHLDKVIYFTEGNWRIYISETAKAIDRQNAKDKKIFYCDLRELSWEYYTLVMWRGLMLYILKERSSLETSRRVYNKLLIRKYILYAVCALLLLFWIIKFINYVF